MACTTSTPDNEVTYMTETEVREFNAKLEKKHVNNKYNMVTSCSYDNLKKLYDELQKQFSDLDEQYNENYIQVQAYKSSLKTLEKQKKILLNNQLVFEEKIRVLSSELENTTNLLKYSEKVNAEMSLEKQDLQAKLENERAINAKWTSSSKNLVKLIDSSMTVRTKSGLGFDKYIGENELGWDDSEFSVFTPTPEDVEGTPLYNRFVKTDRMKAVPPPLSGNYIPLSDPTDLDESQMTYGPKQTHTSDSEPKTSDLDSCESNSSVESLESMPKPVIIEPKTSEYAPCKSNLSAESPEFIPKSVCARNESVRKADNPRKNNKSPRGNKRSWNGMMTQKLGENFEFNNKACYVCGRFGHLHYTCKNKRKVNDQKQVTPVWNNSRRVNHQNFGRFSHPSPKSNMVPQALLTKSGLVYVNSLKRLFQKKTPNNNKYFNRSVNSVKDTRVHTARPKTEVNTVKASASWVWKPKQEVIDHVSKSNNASKTLTRYDYVDAYGRFKTVLAWDFKRH
ncbi:ribonuclease H-like domain-containing protein [Tanacetum coccineum]